MIISITDEVIDMGTTTKLITDELYNRAKVTLSSMNKDERVAIRLRAIVAAKEHGIELVSKVFNITSNTLRNWVKSFRTNDREALLRKSGQGRKCKITDDYRVAILTWVKEDCNITIQKILLKLKKQFGLNSSKSAVHRVLKEMNLSHITPRPKHYKQDPLKKEEFKKKSGRSNRW